MRRHGFTLIELAIVIAVVGVLVAVSGPALAGWYRQRTTAAAKDRLVLSHSLARATALQYGRVTELHIDAAAARFWVEVDTSATGVRDTVGPVHDLGGGELTMTSNRARLCFDARGVATARGLCEPADATILFATPGRVDSVTIMALGKVVR